MLGCWKSVSMGLAGLLGRVVVLVLAVVGTAIFSYYLHIPERPPIFDNPGLSYSDIVYGLFNPIFRDMVGYGGVVRRESIERLWFNSDMAVELATGRRVCPLPYRDYRFEYPPLIGFLWMVSVCTSVYLVLPDSYTALEYFTLSKSMAEVHYGIHSAVLVAFLAILIVYMYRIAVLAELSWKRIVLFLLLPSTVLYTIYNWDAIPAAFTIMAIYYMVTRRYSVSGFMLGLGISAKLLPIAPASVLVYDMVQKYRKGLVSRRQLVNMVVGIAVAGLAPYLAILAVSYNGFIYFVEHHAQWYCENCIYSLITWDIWSPLNRVYATVSTALSLLLLLAIDIDYTSHRQVIGVAAVSMIIVTALNYVFSPQMMLMITPLAVLALEARHLPLLVLADTANFGIMALFYKDAETRRWLANTLGIGIDVKSSPWTPDSPVQIAAFTRNVVLLIVAVNVAYGIYRSRRGEGSSGGRSAESSGIA
ncbi:MAG: hypothetical protein QXN17_07470 [Nitrososphaerota archaeon]